MRPEQPGWPLTGESATGTPCYPTTATSQGPNDPLPAGPLRSVWTRDLHRVEREPLRAQVELVALGAPQEIEAPHALLDAAPDEQHYDHDPRRQGGGGGVKGRIVEVERPRVGERERGRDPLPPHLEEVERKEAEGLERPGDPREEPGTLDTHELALLALAGAVHGKEVLEVGPEGLLGGGGEAGIGGCLLEAPKLAPQFMAAAAPELFQVGVEGPGQAQHRGHLVLVHFEREAQAVGGLDEPLGEPEGHGQAAGVEAAPRGDVLE